MSEDEVGGVHLTHKQIVFGVMTATVVAVVVFLCGVFVGRGVLALRPDVPDNGMTDNRVAPDPAVPLADADAGSASAGDVGAAISPPPEKLTYPALLGKGTSSQDSLAGLAEPGPPAPPPDAPDGSADGAGAPVGAPVKPVAGGTPPKPAAVVSSAMAPASPSVPQTAAPAGSNAADPADVGPYTVQVSAVRTRKEAQLIVDSLKKRGFPAFLFEPPPGDPRGGFRVRVGSYKSRQEAAAMVSRLQKQKEKYQPWITR